MKFILGLLVALSCFGLHAADIKVTTEAQLEQANNTAKPGDTIYVDIDRIDDTRIQPKNSGNNDAYISYIGIDKPVISSCGVVCMKLDNRNYIRVQGFKFDGEGIGKKSNITNWFTIKNAHWNVLYGNTFLRAAGWYGGLLDLWASHNVLSHNRFEFVGEWCKKNAPSTHECMTGDMLAMKCAANNLIVDNYFGAAGHNPFTAYGDRNVFLNNVFENNWKDVETGKGYRTGELSVNQKKCKTATGYNVFDGNIVRNAGDPPGQWGDAAVKVEGENQIVRRSVFANNEQTATFSSNERSGIVNKSEDGHIYNITVLKMPEDGKLWDDNNKAKKGEIEGYVFANVAGDATVSAKTVVGKNNLRSALFWDELKLDENYRPLPGSPLIDAGEPLTKTSMAGEGKVVAVEDVGYFSDGIKGILEGDKIVVGNNSAVIVNIDYKANKLMLDKSLTWDNGDMVTLLFYGRSPDLGAFEYVPPDEPPLPVERQAIDVTVTVPDKDKAQKLVSPQIIGQWIEGTVKRRLE